MEEGSADDGTVDDGAIGDDGTSPMEGNDESDVGPGPAIPAGQPPQATYAQIVPPPAPPDSQTAPVFDSEEEEEDPDPGADSEQSRSRYTPNTGFGAGLYDAANAFQALNHYLMLWNCGHL